LGRTEEKALKFLPIDYIIYTVGWDEPDHRNRNKKAGFNSAS
tara:strand:- start:548 stop:673 length:126 start_codon:yes stop_codon:yes gene_type:complete